MNFSPSRFVATLLLATVAGGAFAQTTGTPSLTRGTANTASAQVTADASSRTLSVPLRTANLATPSTIELMYTSYHAALKQFGYEAFAGPIPLVLPRGRTPEPYLLGPGDQLTVLLWGDPVDLGELTPQFATKIDGDGTFFYPPVGQIRADGLLRTEAEKSLVAGLAKKYKRFDLRLQVNPQRVFPLTVAGLVAQPGIVMVDSWSSIPEILAQAGGIEKNGTLRGLRLIKADGRQLAIDLYDLLIFGKKPTVKLEEGDVLWVGPIGKTTALVGQVKVPGIFELKPDETFTDLLSFAGGYLPSALGVPVTKVTKTGDSWIKSTVFWQSADFAALTTKDGDVFSFDYPPTVKQSSESLGFVKVSGEVGSPGFVAWSPGLTLAQVLEKAGGLLPSANEAGIVLTRADLVTLQRQQVASALQNNQTMVAALQTKLSVTVDPALQDSIGQELAARIEVGNVLTQSLNGDALGRIQVQGNSKESPLLQPGDSVKVPRDSGVVLVLGEVYNPGAQLWHKGLTVKAALDAVGGISVNGTPDEVYILKASGRVDSVRAQGNFLGMSALWGMELQTGDVIYAPTKRAESTQFWASIKDVVSVVSEATGTVANVFVVLKTLGVL